MKAWLHYRADVWQWWSAVYEVFSTGGDCGPVQAQLVEERIVEQHIDLLAEIRRSLRRCAARPQTDRDAGKLLQVIADMIDENVAFNLGDIATLLSSADSMPNSATSSAVVPPGRGALPPCLFQVGSIALTT